MSISVRVVNSAENPLPAYETPGSAGMDLRALLPQPQPLRPGESTLIPTGLRLEIPPGYEAQIRPRSGLALQRGLTVLNAPGTIDSDYRGEVGVILINFSSESQIIETGERIAQLVFAPVTKVELVDVEELSTSNRGTSGFGSTGDH